MKVKVKNTYIGNRKLNQIIEDAIEQGVRDNAELILGEAVRRAPILTSALRQSGKYELNRSVKGIQARIYFDTPYAAAQHQGDFQHPRGGERYYLENALKTHALRLPIGVAMRIKKARRI